MYMCVCVCVCVWVDWDKLIDRCVITQIRVYNRPLRMCGGFDDHWVPHFCKLNKYFRHLPLCDFEEFCLFGLFICVGILIFDAALSDLVSALEIAI